MSSIKQLFLNHVGQTGPTPLMLEVDRAEHIYIYDVNGKKYTDLNSGISISSMGHRHPRIVKAIKDQLDRYMHTMVYGEHVQSPQVQFAHLLTQQLAQSLNSVYFVMTGSEAVEVAMKLAKRYTGRYEIIACRNAYHGSTQGSESLRSDKDYSRAFLPLIPGIKHIDFNNEQDLEHISHSTAAVIVEPVQGEAGVIVPQDNYLSKLQRKCKEVGALFILDEIQTGFGRTGELFAHHKYNVVPDVLLIAKAMGGGMPIGAVVSDKDILQSFIKNPSLGHITSFGGHPVSSAAALASLKLLLEEDIYRSVELKANIFREMLSAHDIVREVRFSGLLMAVELTKRKYLKHLVSQSFKLGVIVDYFLFNNRSFRLAPPLVITEEEIKEACGKLLASLDYAKEKYK